MGDASIKHVAMENRLYPMRELLADLLLEAGRAKDAAVEYTRALKQTPNRYRGLLGAARAAEAAGDTAAARTFYARVIELSAHADGVRPNCSMPARLLSGSTTHAFGPRVCIDTRLPSWQDSGRHSLTVPRP